MIIQVIFSVIAIGLLYLFNKKLGIFSTSLFTNEKMAKEIMQQDFPDTKLLKLNQTLFLNKKIALFEYTQLTSKKNQVFGISQAIGDVFVSRQLPLSILKQCAKDIKVTGNQFHIKLITGDMTLPPITIKFNDTDPLYYWFLEQKFLSANSSLTSDATAMPNATAMKEGS